MSKHHRTQLIVVRYRLTVLHWVFLLAAQSLGLAAIPQAAVAAYSPWLRDYFGLPENRLVVCGISFGHADRAHPANGFQTNRAPISDAVDWRE